MSNTESPQQLAYLRDLERYAAENHFQTQHGHSAFIKRAAWGHWCGYLRLLPDEHIDDMSLVPIHGGETSLCSSAARPGDYIGFDCAHGGDYCPLLRSHDGGELFWTYEMVKQELELVSAWMRGYKCGRAVRTNPGSPQRPDEPEADAIVPVSDGGNVADYGVS